MGGSVFRLKLEEQFSGVVSRLAAAGKCKKRRSRQFGRPRTYVRPVHHFGRRNTLFAESFLGCRKTSGGKK